MSYSLSVYSVDLDKLRRCVGSRDAALVAAIHERCAEALRHDERASQSRGEAGAATVSAALEQLVNGKVPPDARWGAPYGYALEMICGQIGEKLPADAFEEIDSDFVEAVEWPLVMEAKGSPVPLPPIEDFPVIGHLGADEVNRQLTRLREEEEELDEDDDATPELIEAREQCHEWLEHAARARQGLCSFYS